MNKKKTLKERIEEHIEVKHAIFLTLLAVSTIAMLFFFIFLPIVNIGGSPFLDTSKNIECGKNIQDALHTFSQNMSMPYKIEPEEYKIIFDKGQIQKEYNRDGINYIAYFNLNITEKGCNLKYFKRGKSEPGSRETTLGNYGSIVLTMCQCK